MITGFHHVSIKTREWDRTMRFYCEVLGCIPRVAWRAAPARAVLLQVPGSGSYIEVFEDLSYAAAANGGVHHFALRTDSVDRTIAKVREGGAKITVEPRNVTIPNTTSLGPVPIRLFFCEGPNGEQIEFFENTVT